MENIYIKNNNLINNLEIQNTDLIKKGIITKKNALNCLQEEKSQENVKLGIIAPSSILLGTTVLLSNDFSNNGSFSIVLGICIVSFIIKFLEYFKNMNEINSEIIKIKKMSEKEHRIYQLKKIINDTSLVQEELNNYKNVLEEISNPKKLTKTR